MDEKAYASKIREAVSGAIKKVHNNPGHEPRTDT
jgi:hypothetical protein